MDASVGSTGAWSPRTAHQLPVGPAPTASSILSSFNRPEGAEVFPLILKARVFQNHTNASSLHNPEEVDPCPSTTADCISAGARALRPLPSAVRGLKGDAERTAGCALAPHMAAVSPETGGATLPLPASPVRHRP